MDYIRFTYKLDTNNIHDEHSISATYRLHTHYIPITYILLTDYLQITYALHTDYIHYIHNILYKWITDHLHMDNIRIATYIACMPMWDTVKSWKQIRVGTWA